MLGLTCIDNDDIRKSAAWSGGDGDDEDLFEDDRFLDFGDSMYSDSAAAAGKKATVVNSVSYTRNRAKITNPKVNIEYLQCFKCLYFQCFRELSR